MPQADASSIKIQADALLEPAVREVGRGQLKIFLGAAPGVGKTYEMLLTAQARRRDGDDVVIGVVETHGRAETEALLAGLETVPLREANHGGHRLQEMDLEAVLARRPQLVLVDELAHTNAPGGRHPKRYLDVEDLLSAGIDVFTTLNIQHVESLNAVVAGITRIRVRETVPDSILDRADDIEVVDLAPQDLIRRLEDGKVYVPRQAERALRHYFSPGNLTALRELALRRTAQRVDDQLLTHMQTHAIAGPWEAGERVLVCIDATPEAADLIRYAKRMADRLRASWTVLTIETAASHNFTDEERDRLAANMRLAEHLGGEAVTLPDDSIVEGILTYARVHNVTHIVIGKSRRSRWIEKFRGTVAGELIRRTVPITIHAVATVEGKARPKSGPSSEDRRQAGALSADCGYAFSLVAIAVGLALLFQPITGSETADLFFLTAIIVSAIYFGRIPSLLASVVASLAYNFFFLNPLYTFSIADGVNIASFCFFFAIALLVSGLGTRMREAVIASRERARVTDALYGFSRKIAGIVSLDDLLWASAYQIAFMLRLDVLLMLPENGKLAVKCGYPPEDQVDEADMGAATWAFDTNRPAGRGADTLSGAKRLFLPLKTAHGSVGVVGLSRKRPGALVSPDDHRLLEALIDQIAVAVERINLAREMDETRMISERERLRSALLASLSHDLKTPLAAILGAATSLKQFGELYSPDQREDLISTVEDEAERLNRFVANLLDMTRIETGSIALNWEAVEPGEAIGAVLQRGARMLSGHHIELAIAPDLPLVKVDPVLFEQVLFNLLDNAVKYSSKGSTIIVRGRRDGASVEIDIEDEGRGLPHEETERIFDKFHRVGARDRQLAGTGLGLAICRGFMAEMGGTVTATNRSDAKGAIFTLSLPVLSQTVDLRETE